MVELQTSRISWQLRRQYGGGVHKKCFYLAEQALICKGSMHDVFGYLATTIAVRQVLAGTYSYPADFDQAT